MLDEFVKDLRRRFEQGDIVTRLLFINVGVFLCSQLLKIGYGLFQYSFTWIERWLALSASFTALIGKPWTLITYMFLHADLWHILFNMLWLYWFGALFLRFFTSRHLLGLYLLGGIFGGLMYMVCYNVFPYFSSHVPYATLVGASASVLAIVVATAVRAPEMPVRLLILGELKLKYFALLTIILDLLMINSANAGGHLAHLGGALSGWLFAYGLSTGRDYTAWITRAYDFIAGLFQRKAQPRMKVRPTATQTETASSAEPIKPTPTQPAKDEEIERILEKLRTSGYAALSADEKKRLFDASKR